MVSEAPLQHRPAAARSLYVWGAVAVSLIAFGVVFVVPWFVPMPSATAWSEAAAAGFNNRVAYAGLALLAVLVGAIGYVGGRSSQRANIVVPVNPRSRNLVWAYVAVGTLVVLGATIAWYMLLGGRLVNDAGYFLDRMMYLRNGSAIYRDFEFSYGPLMLYVPYVAWRVLAWVGVPIQAAYLATFVMFASASLLMAAYVIRRLSMPVAVRGAVAAALVIPLAMQATLGVNTSYVRALAVYVALLAVMREAADGSIRPAWRRALEIVLAAALVFAISPEMGVALLIGLGATSAVMIAQGARGYALDLATVVAIALGLAALLAAPGSTFGAFAGGAFLLPAVPGVAALVYVGTVLLSCWAAGREFDGGVAGATQVGFAVIGLVLTAAALGRADFGHVFMNGLGPLLLSVSWLSHTRREWAAYAVGLGTIGVAVAGFALWSSVNVGFARTMPAEVPQATMDSAVADLLARGRTAIPMRLDPALGVPLAQARGLQPVFVWYEPTTSAQEDRVLAGIARANQVVLTKDASAAILRIAAMAQQSNSGTASVDPLVAEPGTPILNARQSLVAYGLPVAIPRRHPLPLRGARVALEISDHWKPGWGFGDYRVWVRK